MRSLLKPLLLLTLALMVPCLPFISFGPAMEAAVTGWLQSPPENATLALGIAALLATDILLPIPSSTVSTVGGAAVGTATGTLASWAGMTAGAMLGFWLARKAGRPLALRLSAAEELQRMQRLTDQVGPLVVVLTRPVPVMAEASVLFLGATGLPWRRFLLPMAAANLGVAWAYSAVGDWAQQNQLLTIGLAFSVALPVLLTMTARRWLRSGSDDSTSTVAESEAV